MGVLDGVVCTWAEEVNIDADCDGPAANSETCTGLAPAVGTAASFLENIEGSVDENAGALAIQAANRHERKCLLLMHRV